VKLPLLLRLSFAFAAKTQRALMIKKITSRVSIFTYLNIYYYVINLGETMYTYNAYVTEVYDGDTITVDIDLGFGIKITNQKIRLFGINAPELKGKTKSEGIKSRDKLTELILNKQVKIETVKDKKEKYGRLLGKIWIEDTMVNDVLLKEGFAVSYMADED